MKKIIVTAFICGALSLMSGVALAENISSTQPIIGSDLCIHPQDWQITDRFPDVVLTCAAKRVTCTLVDLSGGIVNDNFWEIIDWSFTKSNGAQLSNQCTAYPMNPHCDFNTPRTTCAALYSTQMTH
ncbi:MAG: hypothetical protein NTU49_11450 [Gammaproteobacteria bacterium]|nr:hypothetical protein [Gammaproteobacteria bacterium]